jgi:RimJ/RimL family protein N-acetyltransferase
MRHVLTTDRLVLEPCTLEDAAALHGLFVEPDVRRQLLEDRIVHRPWAEARIAASVERFANDGLGLWVARKDGVFVGAAGFLPISDPSRPELFFALASETREPSLLVELARSVVAHAFEHGGQEIVRCTQDRPNQDAITALQQLGFACTSERGRWLGFELSAAQWDQRKS